MDIMRVDCNRCEVRGLQCGDCVISVLLGVPEGIVPEVELVDSERAALEALAESGLVPPLRLVRSTGPFHWSGEHSHMDNGDRFAE